MKKQQRRLFHGNLGVWGGISEYGHRNGLLLAVNEAQHNGDSDQNHNLLENIDIIRIHIDKIQLSTLENQLVSKEYFYKCKHVTSITYCPSPPVILKLKSAFFANLGKKDNFSSNISTWNIFF